MEDYTLLFCEASIWLEDDFISNLAGANDRDSPLETRGYIIFKNMVNFITHFSKFLKSYLNFTGIASPSNILHPCTSNCLNK